MTVLLDDLRRRWAEEAAQRGADAVARAFREAEAAIDDAGAAIEALRNEPDPEVGSPWRRSS